jgi:hypothetical protein
MLRPYGLTEGDLKLRGFKALRQTIAIKKVGKQTQIVQLMASLARER